jgi:multidrug efflux system outer membrane protein
MNKQLLLMLAATTMLTSCSLSPDFQRPEVQTSEHFKEEAPIPDDASQGKWKPAVSLEKEKRGEWWAIFEDTMLNDLEKQAIDANQSLKAAGARVEEARAVVRANALSFLPNIDVGANALRAKPGDAGVVAFGGPAGATLKPYNLYSANGIASYEVDLFGRVRDSASAFSFDADATEALYQSTLLALQADVAQHYFQLQSIDAERVLLKDTIEVRKEANRIMQKRFDVGTASEVDTSRTQSELAGANAELIVLERQRAAFENAMAVLLGKDPSSYHFPESPLVESRPPIIPAGIPSEILLRRPDIAQAVANMQAANKRIGVARTSFFPSLILTASGGFESTELSDLFKWSSRTWALGQVAGSALAWNIFESGRNVARVDAAQAAYEEAVANYRQQVLAALSDVETALTDQRLLASQTDEQDKAAKATAHTLDLVAKRYYEGDISYFELVDTQRNMLLVNRAAIQTRGARLAATVTLIRALGGSWSDAAPALIESAPAETKETAPLIPSTTQVEAPVITPTPERENGLIIPEPSK